MKNWMFLLLTAPLLWFPCAAQALERKLAHDTYQPGDEASYQAGFVSSEMLGSTFAVEPDEYPFELLSIEVLVGDGSPGGTTQGTFIVHIWEDNGGEEPGAALVTPFSVVLTAGYLNIISLTGMGLPEISSGAVRIGLEFTQNPPPSFLTDADGFITQHVNTLYSINFGWHYAEFYGLTGDWIVRLIVDTAIELPTMTPTVTPEPGTPGPTWTPLPTYTPCPTYTPQPTYTPYPTSTALPTYTPPPTATVDPTATPDHELSEIKLWMPVRHVTPGVPFMLNVIITNSGQPIDNARLMTMMIIHSDVWYYPSWSQSFDAQILDLAVGETIVNVIPEFSWPSGVGSLDSIIFSASVTDTDFNDLSLYPDTIIWSYSE